MVVLQLSQGMSDRFRWCCGATKSIIINSLLFFLCFRGFLSIGGEMRVLATNPLVMLYGMVSEFMRPMRNGYNGLLQGY